jgi:small subunit ribosomal protein S17e
LIGAYPNNFSTNFEENKKKLKGRAIMPSNKIRNQIAGYITRLKKLEARSDEQTVRI